jgi:hypothetical protein
LSPSSSLFEPLSSMPLTGDASVGGIFVDGPWGDRGFYQSVIYKPGECEISFEVCFPLIYARPPPPVLRTPSDSSDLNCSRVHLYP